MNQHVQSNQSMSSLLASVSTVVSVTGTLLGLARTDKRASAESDRAHNAENGTGRVTVIRLPGAEDRIKELRQIKAAATDALNNCTTAWGDRRMLPNDNIELWLNSWTKLKGEFDLKVQQLIHDAPALLAAAAPKLGTYDVEPPTVEEIASAFSMEFKMEPVPDASHFKATNLDKAVETALKARFEADISAAYQLAQKDALKRLAEPLGNLVERLGNYSKRQDAKAAGTAGKHGILRDAVLENVQEIARVFGSFNLTGDPHLDAIAKALDVFNDVDTESLKADAALRENTKKKAAEILAKLGDWI